VTIERRLNSRHFVSHTHTLATLYHTHTHLTQHTHTHTHTHPQTHEALYHSGPRQTCQPCYCRAPGASAGGTAHHLSTCFQIILSRLSSSLSTKDPAPSRTCSPPAMANILRCCLFVEHHEAHCHASRRRGSGTNSKSWVKVRLHPCATADGLQARYGVPGDVWRPCATPEGLQARYGGVPRVLVEEVWRR
jgi:hypothetical protein